MKLLSFRPGFWRLALRACAPLALTACFAQRVVFTPTQEQQRLLDGPPIDLSVAVVHFSPTEFSGRKSPVAYASKLAKLLRASHAFRSVTYDSSGRPAPGADLVAVSTGDYCNSSSIPFFTILTLGVVPTVWDETNCDGVSFRSARVEEGDSSAMVPAACVPGPRRRRNRARPPAAQVPDCPVTVATAHEGRTGTAIMGWAAAPMGLLPGWSWKLGADQPAYQQAFRLAIIAHKDELMQLAAEKATRASRAP
jgi:hypothetical protein